MKKGCDHIKTFSFLFFFPQEGSVSGIVISDRVVITTGIVVRKLKFAKDVTQPG